MANRIRATIGLSASELVFNPSSLFYNAELGFIENLLGSSTLFQDSAGTTPAVLGSVIGRINSANGSGVYASQATTSKKPILKRKPTSGIRNLLQDSDNVTVGSDWGSLGSWTITPANPYNPGGSSYKFVNDGGASSRNMGRSYGASDGSIMSLSVVFEKSADEDALVSVVTIRDHTAGAFVARTNFTWGTETFTTPNGTGTVEKLAEVGPNGGKVFRVVASGAVTAGNTLALFVYPTNTDVNTRSVIVHRAQYEKNNVATNQQITVGGYDVYEEGFDQVYWLDYDGADDELVLNNPDLGSNATRIRAQLGGPVIEQGLTLGANLTLNTDNLGLILLNRPLTSDELAAITNYYTRMVA